MKKHVFWRLFIAAVLTMTVWNAMGLEVYGAWNDSGSGGTLLDVFRGRGSSSNSAPKVETPMQSDANYGAYNVPAPQMTNVPATPMTNMNDSGRQYEYVEGTQSFPSPQYAPPAAPTPQGSVQNKWSIKSWLTGAAPVQPQSQYVEPAPPLAPAYNHPHSHASHQAMPSGQKTQYPVVPLDSKDFLPQEGAVYNEKGEMIYNPETGGSLPNFADSEIQQDGGEWAVPSNENMQNVPVMPLATPNSQLVTPNVAAPRNESEPGVKRIIMGGRARQSTPLNQERIYSPAPDGVVHATPQLTPAPMPVNPFAQQPTAGSGKSIINSGNSGSLKLESGSAAFSETYKPINRLTSVPSEPVMDMAGPELTEALPQSENMGQGTPEANAAHSPAIGAAAPSASPVIEDLHSSSPLENLSEKSGDAPVLEPVPESVPEIDVPKEKTVVQTPAFENKSLDVEKKPVVNETIVKSEPVTKPVDGASKSSLTQTAPLIIEIDGPNEVEFGKNEMFSLSVINTTDAVRRDIVLSVHPEGFGDDKTAKLNLEQLESGEKKSIYMKLNARQHNNLSLTAQVRDSSGFEATKTINVNVKDESIKISILPPQTGNAYVGQPTEYLVRIVNNADKTVSFNAMAFFGNGIEPIRASGAPNTIQSGQVVVNNPIELKQGEMRDLKIVAVAFQPGIHKILVQLIDSRGATYAVKESCAYRQREFDDNDSETIESDARIELTPGKSEIGVWKAAGESDSRQEAVGSSDSPSANNSTSLATRNSQLTTPDAPTLNAPDAVPLTQPDQGPRGDLIMPMFAQ